MSGVTRELRTEIRWIGDEHSEAAVLKVLGYSDIDVADSVYERWMRVPVSLADAVRSAILQAGGFFMLFPATSSALLEAISKPSPKTPVFPFLQATAFLFRWMSGALSPGSLRMKSTTTGAHTTHSRLSMQQRRRWIHICP
jgi:hypothetical protein